MSEEDKIDHVNPLISATEIILSPFGKIKTSHARLIHKRLGEAIKKSDEIAAQEALDKNQLQLEFDDEP